MVLGSPSPVQTAEEAHMHRDHLIRSDTSPPIPPPPRTGPLTFWVLIDRYQIIHVLEQPHKLSWVIFDQCEDDLHQPAAGLRAGDGMARPKLPCCILTGREKVFPEEFSAHTPEKQVRSYPPNMVRAGDFADLTGSTSMPVRSPSLHTMACRSRVRPAAMSSTLVGRVKSWRRVKSRWPTRAGSQTYLRRRVVK